MTEMFHVFLKIELHKPKEDSTDVKVVTRKMVPEMLCHEMQPEFSSHGHLWLCQACSPPVEKIQVAYPASLV